MKLEIKELTKFYGSKCVLDEFTFDFTPGVYGLLGPNGAGKSTFMNLLTDNITRNSGSILCDGTEILKMGKKYRKMVGYMPQQQNMFEHFSAYAFMQYIGLLKEIPQKELPQEIKRCLKLVNMHERRGDKIKSFSGGMKQRLLLAQALLGDPKIIILDEPTAGLDPKERINIRNIIADIAEDKIIILATHVVSDIECIAKEVVFVKTGNLIHHGTPIELMKQMKGKVVEIPCSQHPIKECRRKYPHGNAVQREDGLYYRVVGDELPNEGERVASGFSLEDVYQYLYGMLKSYGTSQMEY